MRRQKQEGYHIVDIPLLLGNISADAMGALAGVVEAFGEGVLRTTQSQNACLRWLHEAELPAVRARLSALGLARAMPPVLRDMSVCAGAATCKLGICLSGGLAQAASRELERSRLELARLGEVKLHTNGCPNACARHPVAQLALCGVARRIGGRLVPCYVFQLQSRVGEGRTRLAEGRTALPARNIPAFLTDLFAAFWHWNGHAGFDAFLEAGGREAAEAIAQRHKAVPEFEQDKNYYFDWGAEAHFSLAGRGPGECGAGVFDLIEVDLATATDALAEGRLFTATARAAARP